MDGHTSSVMICGLSTDTGYLECACLIWSMKVIVPNKLPERVLEELHYGYMGIVKMKSLARSHV